MTHNIELEMGLWKLEPEREIKEYLSNFKSSAGVNLEGYSPLVLLDKLHQTISIQPQL